MIEIELFYRIVESEIRKRHIKYLKRRKVVSAELDDSENSEEQKSDASKEANENTPVNICGGDNALKVRRFNKGIDTALKVLACEYKRFAKRMSKDDKSKGLM